MLAISPKGTVPVLQLTNGKVLEESLDIMNWALDQNDPSGLVTHPDDLRQAMAELITENDKQFKQALDGYKYPDRLGEPSDIPWRQQGELFLAKLEKRLSQKPFLFTEQPSLADLAIFPFVRQFAHVDEEWFLASHYSHLIKWYQHFSNNPLFTEIMQKHHMWNGS